MPDSREKLPAWKIVLGTRIHNGTVRLAAYVMLTNGVISTEEDAVQLLDSMPDISELQSIEHKMLGYRDLWSW